MDCLTCKKPILDGEDYATHNGTVSHLCCFVFDIAFEVDNTMMCFGIVETSAFEKARRSFQIAFLKTYTIRCQHMLGAKGWPWGNG